MMNTVCTLVGEDFETVAAWTDNRGTPVDINGVVMGRLQSGGLVTLNGCGDCIAGLENEIFVNLTGGTIRTGVYGERLFIRRAGESQATEADLPKMRGAWEQFTQVRAGEIENPCPARSWLAYGEALGCDRRIGEQRRAAGARARRGLKATVNAMAQRHRDCETRLN